MKRKLTILVCVSMIVTAFTLIAQNQKILAKINPSLSPMLLIQNSAQSKDKGIGPVKNIALGPIDQKMANEGKTIFTGKCTVCHSLDQKIIGPPLRNITKTRTPEYIMNMILNPTNMEKEDPVTKVQHKQYVATPMTNQNFTQNQARVLLEYLRSVAK